MNRRRGLAPSKLRWVIRGQEKFNKNNVCGGQGGIRTHGRLPPTAVFKTAALNHSATCPARLGALACIAVKLSAIQAESVGQAEVAARVERVTSQMPPQTRIRAIR